MNLIYDFNALYVVLYSSEYELHCVCGDILVWHGYSLKVTPETSWLIEVFLPSQTFVIFAFSSWSRSWIVQWFKENQNELVHKQTLDLFTCSPNLPAEFIVLAVKLSTKSITFSMTFYEAAASAGISTNYLPTLDKNIETNHQVTPGNRKPLSDHKHNPAT